MVVPNRIGTACLLFTLVALHGAAQEHAPSPETSSLQEASPEVLPWPAPEGDVLVNLPTDQTIRKNFLEFLVTHRAHSSVKGSNARSLYSLSSQTVDFGFAYSPIAHTEVSLFRSEDQDDYELSVKYAFRPGGAASVFGAAVRVGGDDRRDPIVIREEGGIERDVKARTAYFFQAVLSLHLLSNRMEVSMVPSYISHTVSEAHVFNLPVHSAFAASRSVNFQVEYEPPRRALPGSVAQWAVGIEKVLSGARHRFTFVVANSTVRAADLYLSGDFQASVKRLQDRFPFIAVRNNDPYLGFNLIRRFNLGK